MGVAFSYIYRQAENALRSFWAIVLLIHAGVDGIDVASAMLTITLFFLVNGISRAKLLPSWRSNDRRFGQTRHRLDSAHGHVMTCRARRGAFGLQGITLAYSAAAHTLAKFPLRNPTLTRSRYGMMKSRNKYGMMWHMMPRRVRSATGLKSTSGFAVNECCPFLNRIVHG